MSQKKNQGGYKILSLLSEIGIVTIGILIAYQLNNWKEVSSLKNAEEKMLQEIKANLELDLIDLKGNRNAHKTALSIIDTLGIIAENDVYNDEIPLLIRHALRDFVFNPQTSAFETLKAKGVHLITNDSIRIRILRLYDFEYHTIEKVEESYEPHQFSSYYRHIVFNYFDGFDLSNKETIKPIYPGTKWLLNSDVKNRLDLTKSEHQFALRLYDGSIAEVIQLIQTIQEEIETEF
ncbi:MAG: DUF6090 family protein [Ekhidna sp.]